MPDEVWKATRFIGMVYIAIAAVVMAYDFFSSSFEGLL